MLVLIVDDTAANLTLASILLEAAGYKYMLAMDAEAARSILKEFNPGIIILDLLLPKTDGFTFCRELRSNSRFEKTAIISMTAYLDDSIATRAKEAGFDYYLPKPFTSKEFIELLDSIRDELHDNTRS